MTEDQGRCGASTASVPFSDNVSRRRILHTVGASGITGLAGCSGILGSADAVVTHIYINVERSHDGRVNAKIALAGQVGEDSIDELELSDVISVHRDGIAEDEGVEVKSEDVRLDFTSDDLEGTVAENISEDAEFLRSFDPDDGFQVIKNTSGCGLEEKEDEPPSDFIEEDFQQFTDDPLLEKPRFPDGKKIGPEAGRVESGELLTGKILNVGELNSQGGIKLGEIKVTSGILGDCPVQSFIRMPDGFLYEFIDDTHLTDTGFLSTSGPSNDPILRCEDGDSRTIDSLGGIEHYPDEALAELKEYAIRKDTGLQYIHQLAVAMNEEIERVEDVSYDNVFEDATDFGTAGLSFGLTLHSALYFAPQNLAHTSFHLFQEAVTEDLNQAFNDGKSAVEQYYAARENFLSRSSLFSQTVVVNGFDFFDIALNINDGLHISDLIGDIRNERRLLNELAATPLSEQSRISSLVGDLEDLYSKQGEDIDHQMFELSNGKPTGLSGLQDCGDTGVKETINILYVLFGQMSSQLRILDIFRWLGEQWTGEYSRDGDEEKKYLSKWDEVGSVSAEGEQSDAVLKVSNDILGYECPDDSTIHLFSRSDQERIGEITSRKSWWISEGNLAAVCPTDTSDPWNRRVCMFEVDEHLTELWTDTEVTGVDIAVRNNVYAIDHQNNIWDRFRKYESHSGNRAVQHTYEPRTDHDIAVPGNLVSEWTGPVIPGDESAVFFGAADQRSTTVGHIINPDTGEQRTTFEYTEGELLPGETGVFEVTNDEITFITTNGQRESLFSGDEAPQRITTLGDHLIYVEEPGTLHSISPTGNETGPVDSFDEIEVTRVVALGGPVPESNRQVIVVMSDTGGWYAIEIDAELTPMSILNGKVLSSETDQSTTLPSAVAQADQVCIVITDKETVTIFQGEETDSDNE